MTTRNPPVPTYTDLARAGAVIKRTIEPESCERLLPLVEELEVVSVELSFSLDAHNRVKVTGSAVARVKLACQLCMLPVARELRADVEGGLVASEQEADAWRAEDRSQSIIVISGPALDELELLEDELLLRLPSQVCSDTACAQRPLMAYGPALSDATEQDERRPFAGLDKLLSAQEADKS